MNAACLPQDIRPKSAATNFRCSSHNVISTKLSINISKLNVRPLLCGCVDQCSVCIFKWATHLSSAPCLPPRASCQLEDGVLLNNFYWGSQEVRTKCECNAALRQVVSLFFFTQTIRASGLVLLEAILCGALLLYFPVSLTRMFPFLHTLAALHAAAQAKLCSGGAEQERLHCQASAHKSNCLDVGSF